MAITLVEFHHASGNYSSGLFQHQHSSLPFQPLGTFHDVRYKEVCTHIPLNVSQDPSVPVHTGREQLGRFDPSSNVRSAKWVFVYLHFFLNSHLKQLVPSSPRCVIHPTLSRPRWKASDSVEYPTSRISPLHQISHPKSSKLMISTLLEEGLVMYIGVGTMTVRRRRFEFGV